MLLQHIYALQLATHSQASTAEDLETVTVGNMLGRSDSIVVALAQMRCPKVWVSSTSSHPIIWSKN